jgi:4-hydroxybenzoyl-CoA reductase subunit beta
MEHMSAFTLRRPTSIAEAAALLATEKGARLLAGGTGLLPNLRRRIERPAVLVDLGGVHDFAGIAFTDEGLWLGAGTTLSAIASDRRFVRGYGAIAEAGRTVAGPAHRSVATIGGNLCLDTRCVFYNQSEWWRATNAYCLKRGGEVCHVAPQGKHCHAAFSGDMAPALLVLGAQVELVASRGARRIELWQLYRDDGAAHLTIAADEVLSRILVRKPPNELVSGYRKACVRGAIDFPLAGVACALSVHAGKLMELRVAITGTNSQPMVLAGTEALLGRTLSADTLSALGKLVQKQVSPMRTTVAQSNYRRLVAVVLTQRLVRELAQGDGAAAAGA